MLLPLLRERGVVVEVAVLRSAKGDEEQLRADGFAIHVLNGASLLSRARSLRRLIASRKPDVVHTALFSADLVGRIGGFRSDAIVVSSLVNTPYDPARMTDPNINRWKLRSVQVIDSVTSRLGTTALHAVSAGVADANATALRYPRERIMVVDRGRSRGSLGGWSVERRAAARAKLGLGPATKVVFTAGRQEYQKAHSDLVAAAVQLRKTIPDLHVLIAGRDGNASADVRHALDRHNANDIVTLLGDRNDVADLLTSADAFCLSSRWEGTAGAALEAMAMRCPIVCTDVAGIRGVLRDGDNALLVPVENPAAMATALSRVLADVDLAEKLRARGEEDFNIRFTIEHSAGEMKRFYEGLATG